LTLTYIYIYFISNLSSSYYYYYYLGGYAKVKEGLCEETLRRVAVKIMTKKRIRKTPTGIQSVIDEISLLRRLKHKNIICLIEVFAKIEYSETGDTDVVPWFKNIETEKGQILENGMVAEKVELLKWYLVLDYCATSLHSLIENSEDKKLDMRYAHHYFSQMMEGIEYLHSQNVIRK